MVRSLWSWPWRCVFGYRVNRKPRRLLTQMTVCRRLPVPSPTGGRQKRRRCFLTPRLRAIYIAGQANIIFQADGPFHSPYEGTNSFIGRGEYKTSLLGTLYLGAQLRRDPKTETDALFNLESSGGRGLSEALGLAGFTNLDVVRNPNLGSVPYMARVQLHQTIGFTDKLIESSRTPFSLATQVPERRLEFHVGKMSLPDYLDINSIGSRQPPAVHELDRRQQWRVGLCRRYPRLHLRRRRRVRR